MTDNPLATNFASIDSALLHNGIYVCKTACLRARKPLAQIQMRFEPDRTQGVHSQRRRACLRKSANRRRWEGDRVRSPSGLAKQNHLGSQGESFFNSRSGSDHRMVAHAVRVHDRHGNTTNMAPRHDPQSRIDRRKFGGLCGSPVRSGVRDHTEFSVARLERGGS